MYVNISYPLVNNTPRYSSESLNQQRLLIILAWYFRSSSFCFFLKKKYGRNNTITIIGMLFIFVGLLIKVIIEAFSKSNINLWHNEIYLEILLRRLIKVDIFDIRIYKRNHMSEGEKKNEKKNTDAWKLKQEEKKKKKQAEQAEGPAKEANQNDGKKGQSKKEKAKAKKEQKVDVKQVETVPEAPITPILPEMQIIYKRLTKIDDKTTQKQRQLSRTYQWELVFKYLEQYIAKHDVILYIGEKQWNPNCQQVYISGFNNCKQAQLVCKYSDITYFLQGSLTKIFIEGLYIFANGSLLAKKGSLNLVLLAEYYGIPVVGCGGSWNFNGWSPLSQPSLIDHFGESALRDYDWIETKYLKSLIIQVGSINPTQVSTFPPIIYKDMNIQSINW